MQYFKYLQQAQPFFIAAGELVRGMWYRNPWWCGTGVFLLFMFVLNYGIAWPTMTAKQHDRNMDCIARELNWRLDMFGKTQVMSYGQITTLGYQAEAATWIRKKQVAAGGEPYCANWGVAELSKKTVDEVTRVVMSGERWSYIRSAVERAYNARSVGAWVHQCKGPLALRAKEANEFKPTQYTSLPRNGEYLCSIGNMSLYHVGKDTPTWTQRMFGKKWW